MAHVLYFTLSNTMRWSVWQGILGAKGILRARAGKEGCTYLSKTSERAGQEAKHWNEWGLQCISGHGRQNALIDAMH